MDNIQRLRDDIRRALINENAFGHSYSNNRHVDAKRNDPQDVQVTDNTTGVMEFSFNSKDMQNPEYVLGKLESYFDDIEVQYVGISDDSDTISVNVKHKYKDLLDALMIHHGFNKSVETWGNEMRSGKRMYSARGSYTGGTQGNFPMPFLFGENPGGTFGGF